MLSQEFDIYELWRSVENDSSVENMSAAKEELLQKTSGRQMNEKELSVFLYLKARLPK